MANVKKLLSWDELIQVIVGKILRGHLRYGFKLTMLD